MSGTSQAAATARCADTAVSKQTTNDTRTLTDNILPTLTGNTQICTVPPTDGQTVCSQPIVHDGLLSSSIQDRGWLTIKQILTHQKRGSRMFYKVEWETGDTSWVPQRDVSEFARDVYWLQKREKARLRKTKRQQRLRQ